MDTKAIEVKIAATLSSIRKPDGTEAPGRRKKKSSLDVTSLSPTVPSEPLTVNRNTRRVIPNKWCEQLANILGALDSEQCRRAQQIIAAPRTPSSPSHSSSSPQLELAKSLLTLILTTPT